jgi:hypothetical protein
VKLQAAGSSETIMCVPPDYAAYHRGRSDSLCSCYLPDVDVYKVTSGFERSVFAFGTQFRFSAVFIVCVCVCVCVCVSLM